VNESTRPEIRPGIRRLFHLALRRRDRARDEADEEIRLHLDLRTRQLMREGLSPETARTEAQRRFGPAEEARIHLHTSAQRREQQMQFRELIDGLQRDLRVAGRGLRRSPGLVVTVVLSLALGIGANAAIFSLFQQLLLRPLPVPHPEQLVKLVAHGTRNGSKSCGEVGSCEETFTYPMFRDIERARTGLTGVAAHMPIDVAVSFGGQPSHERATLVSGEYFRVLGLRPALGRLLEPGDDRSLGAHPVAVLSHRFWQSRLGADPGVLNRTVLVDGQPLTVVGVAPRDFDGTTVGVRPAVFVPLAMTREVGQSIPGMKEFETNRKRYWLYLFGRIPTGGSVEQATTLVNSVYRPIITQVEASLQEGTAREKEEFLQGKLELAPGGQGQSYLPGQVRTPLVLLFSVAGVVLLIACANIASLLLARGASRGMEVAVRLSLGASRRRVVAQLLMESAVLAVLGGAAGLLVGHVTLSLASSVLPPELADTVHLGLRWPMVTFALALSVVTALLFGLFPALHSTRESLVNTIRANAGQIAGARSTMRSHTALVAGQIALSTVLLVAAGLFLKSLRNVSRTELGLSVEHIATFTISPELNGYAPARRKQLFDRVDEELTTIPGVTGVTSARIALFDGGGWGSEISVEGVKSDPSLDHDAMINQVGPHFFRTMGIPLQTGREITAADREGTPGVAVVNEAFVKKFELGSDAVGRRAALWGGKDLNLQIVGVVGNAKYGSVKGESPPAIYAARQQDPNVGAMTYYVRTAGDPAQLLRQIPVLMARLDGDVPVQNLKTMPEKIRENVYLDRMIGTLAGAFAVLATLLAAVGLYGVLAYAVAQRTREIGVRMALGAGVWSVRRLVLRQVGVMTIAGGAIGVVAALALGRTAKSLLYGLEANDPVTVAGAAVVLMLVALGAAYLPARRASRVDPMRALRTE
jgi:predicted permease